MYKYSNGYYIDLMNEVFYLWQNHYNLLSFNIFATGNPRNKYLLNSSVYQLTNSGKHYPPKLRTLHHCSSLKIKSKLGAVIDVNVRFAQDTLPILVTFTLFFLWPKFDRKQNCIVVNFKWPKCPFSVKATYVSLWVWSNFISYVKVFLFFYSYLFVFDVR